MTAPSEPTVHGVRIDAQPGHATISIDGQPLPSGRVVGYQITHDVANELPMLVLHIREPASVAFEGLARVAVAEQPDAGQAIADFVSNLDPAALQRAAFERDDLSGGKTETTEAILRQIAEWALGGRNART